MKQTNYPGRIPAREKDNGFFDTITGASGKPPAEIQSGSDMIVAWV